MQERGRSGTATLGFRRDGSNPKRTKAELKSRSAAVRNRGMLFFRSEAREAVGRFEFITLLGGTSETGSCAAPLPRALFWFC
jgi:hypothetical protein